MIDPIFTLQTVEENAGYGKYILEPLPFSFGQTMGTAFRRTLLSSLEGMAVGAVRVEGAPHLFTTVKGVKESVLDIVLNLKKVRFENVSGEGHRMRISVKGVSKITAADIESDVPVVNKDLYIAEVTDAKGKLELEAMIERGYGFVASEEKEASETGFITVDSSFSPVKKVNYTVEETRVGRKSDYEKLTLEIWTDESVSPLDALKYAAKMVATQFNHLLSADEQVHASTGQGSASSEVSAEDESAKLDDIIIDELNLPSRVINALLRENIETVADLVQTGRKKLIGMKGVGRKSIDLIDDELAKMSIKLD